MSEKLPIQRTDTRVLEFLKLLGVPDHSSRVVIVIDAACSFVEVDATYTPTAEKAENHDDSNR